MTWRARCAERAQLSGCDHKTVAHWMAQREQGLVPKLGRKRPAMEADFMRKFDELVARSSGRIRADVAHGKLAALGYLGSPRTTRRWSRSPSGGATAG